MVKTSWLSPSKALEAAHLVGRLDQFELSRHAIERMDERSSVTRPDIGPALKTATAAARAGERW
jgi:hypothetical protein